ncbi:MAG: hypothetical protein JO048_15315 [Methylobacteriaceae bacterium]|nr:hypothetical protein [Methylobacteriaceae bacterium]
MRRTLAFAAVALAVGTALPALAQAPAPGAAAPSVQRPPAGSANTPARPGATTREPTAGQLAARDRQKKCGVEWKQAKAAGKTAGMKWPQFWSQCNARLKGNQA